VVDFVSDICADHFWSERWKFVKISRQKPKISQE